MQPLRDPRARRQQGSALFVAVLMLVLMGFLGLAALDTVTRDGQIAGVQNQARSAFYAAEAAAAEGRSIVGSPAVDERTDLPAFPYTAGAPRVLSDATLYDREASLPGYFADPAFANPIAYVKDGKILEGNNLNLKGQKLVETFWQINVIGRSTDGSTARLEVVESKPLASSVGSY